MCKFNELRSTCRTSADVPTLSPFLSGLPPNRKQTFTHRTSRRFAVLVPLNFAPASSFCFPASLESTHPPLAQFRVLGPRHARNRSDLCALTWVEQYRPKTELSPANGMVRPSFARPTRRCSLRSHVHSLFSVSLRSSQDSWLTNY